MNMKPALALLGLTFITLLFASWVLAAAPMEAVRQTTDEILAVVTDPAMQVPEKAEERARLIRQAVDRRFDWEDMARRALATHWRARTPEEREEFIALFGDLLEKTYLDRVEGYSGEKIVYLGENVEGEYATVNIKFITLKETEIGVQYRMRQQGATWLVYDISIEGVSFINNYRNQFNSIIVRSSYEDLVRRLKNRQGQ